MQDIVQTTKKRMEGCLEHLKAELKGIRTGRASPAFLESVMVEAYGTPMRLKEVATISVPESRQLLVTPFDAGNVQAIVRGVDKANLGVTCVAEKKDVRVMFPELNQDRRKKLIEECHKKREECKIAVRNIRREENETLKKLKADGAVPEDDFKKLEKQIQDVTDNSCKEADNLTAAKEKEISTV
jgi:ribosome recycling factor